MIYLAVDKNGDELLSVSRLKRSYDNTCWVADMKYCYPDEETLVVLPKGFIKRVLGHVLTWNDDPVEINDGDLDMSNESPDENSDDKYQVFHYEKIPDGKKSCESLEDELNRIHKLGYEIISVNRYFNGYYLMWDIIARKS